MKEEWSFASPKENVKIYAFLRRYICEDAFRFYDVNNTGNVGRNEWVRTFGKIGLNGFSEKDLLFLSCNILIK